MKKIGGAIIKGLVEAALPLICPKLGPPATPGSDITVIATGSSKGQMQILDNIFARSL